MTARLNRWYVWAITATLILFFVLRFFNLTALPIFADEAIYLRWSQLIIDDWRQYAFFPLNDGKTPFQIWLQVPALLASSDPLVAGRVIAGIAGLAQLGAIWLLIKSLGGSVRARFWGLLLVTILPFWLFHHRIALLDGWLSVWMTLSAWAAIELVNVKTSGQLQKKWLASLTNLPSKQEWLWLGSLGTFLGLGFWTKVPTILIYPALIFIPLLPEKMALQQRIRKLLLIGGGAALGIAVFGLLKLNPAFSQLFARGSDFLYPISEVLLDGKWRLTLPNLGTYIWYFVAYVTAPVLALNLYGLFSPNFKRQHWLLAVLAAAFFVPIALFGRVVYPRYFFPTVIFITASAALALDELITITAERARFWQQALLGLIIALLMANIAGPSAVFASQLLVNPDETPLVEADKVQYLYEWSSGHGIVETVNLIQDISQNQSVAVATEGFFGTLPDALLVYFHARDVNNIYIEGIGQPVLQLRPNYANRAVEFDRQLLVVNSHRLKMTIPEDRLLDEFCRPDDAPCLQVWDITDLDLPVAVE